MDQDVDKDKVRFLFGAVPAGAAAGSEDERLELLRADRPGRGEGSSLPSLRLVIANQILDGKPPEVWETAQRLLGSGMGRHEVMDQLTGALFPFVEEVLYDGIPFDPDEYVDALARLPRPAPDAVVQAYVEVARERVAVGAEELDELVTARLGLDAEDPDTVDQLGRAEQALMDDLDAPLTMLAPDVVVHAPALTAGAVLTHRLSAAEHAEGHLELDVDLAGFLRCPQPRVSVGPLHVDDADGGPVSWAGPPGWLADLPRDALLAVRAAEDGEVTVAVLDAEPEVPPELVGTLRAAYDAEVEEPWLPVSAEDIVLGMLYRDRSAFAGPRPPLTELAAAAGLKRRGHLFAHDESVWEEAEQADRQFRLMHRLGTGPGVHDALAAFRLLIDEADDPAALRRALDLLEHPDVLVAVTDELLGDEDDPEKVAALVALADRLVTAAGRSSRAAVARWVAAVAAERDHRVLDAESHLRAAVRENDGWPFTEDRLAWYESDRGDAAAALRRWEAIDAPPDDPDVVAVRPFAAVAAPELGRNQPCWCGSGRKFKQCHLGRPAEVPLPERVGWLCRKAVAYLEQRGGAAPVQDVLAHAAARYPDLDEAMDDPLVLDVVLHEGGWFERFLADRGPLLPADEALLAASWVLVERTVYEVVDVAPGAAVTVRDLRTGDRLDVTERSFSRVATAGSMVCARAVPDGAGHQFVGGIVAVAPGRERQLLELLDRRDGRELLAWVAAAAAPPQLTSTDGDELVDCTVVLRVPGTAAAVLDARYERSDHGWTWDSDDDLSRVLGTIELDGDELTARTLSEPRMDRLLTDLTAVLAGTEVLSDERRPVDVDASAPATAPPVPLDPAVVAELQDRFERRWCDEEVPALDGLTPRAATADPTRRDDVARLIASFPEIDPATGAFGLRPARLRELLGLG